MVRCDDFYCKWQKVGNFCEKHPKTAEQIEAYLNKILPLLEELAAESEILNDGSRAIAPELSEGASRPLISEKDPQIQHEAAKQIVKLAEEKVMDGKKPQVTNREVTQIIESIKEPQTEERQFQPEPNLVHSIKLTHDEAQTLIEDLKKATETANEIVTPPKVSEQVVDPVQAVQEWAEELQAKSEMPAIPKYLTDLLDFKEIKAMLEELSCPCCGKPAAGNLVWKCCGSTLDVAIEKAEAKVDKRFDELNAASKSRREAVAGRS